MDKINLHLRNILYDRNTAYFKLSFGFNPQFHVWRVVSNELRFKTALVAVAEFAVNSHVPFHLEWEYSLFIFKG